MHIDLEAWPQLGELLEAKALALLKSLGTDWATVCTPASEQKLLLILELFLNASKFHRQVGAVQDDGTWIVLKKSKLFFVDDEVLPYCTDMIMHMQGIIYFFTQAGRLQRHLNANRLAALVAVQLKALGIHLAAALSELHQLQQDEAAEGGPTRGAGGAANQHAETFASIFASDRASVSTADAIMDRLFDLELESPVVGKKIDVSSLKPVANLDPFVVINLSREEVRFIVGLGTSARSIGRLGLLWDWGPAPDLVHMCL